VAPCLSLGLGPGFGPGLALDPELFLGALTRALAIYTTGLLIRFY